MIRWILISILGLTLGGGVYTVVARKGPPPDDALSQKAVRGKGPVTAQPDTATDDVLDALDEAISSEKERLKRLQETIRMLRQELEAQHRKPDTTGGRPDSTLQSAPVPQRQP